MAITNWKTFTRTCRAISGRSSKKSPMSNVQGQMLLKPYHPPRRKTMAKIRKFEDVESWKRVRKLTKEIYKATGVGKFARDFGLRDQIRRAAVSILSNIAEGFERGGNKEFLQFLSQAKGSCGEIRAQLYVALDQVYLNSVQFKELIEQTIRVSRLIAGLMKYLGSSDLRGSKYR